MLKNLKNLAKSWLRKKPNPLTPISKVFPIPDMPEIRSFENTSRDIMDTLKEKVLSTVKFIQLTESEQKIYIQLVIDASKKPDTYQKIIEILTDDNI